MVIRSTGCVVVKGRSKHRLNKGWAKKWITTNILTQCLVKYHHFAWWKNHVTSVSEYGKTMPKRHFGWLNSHILLGKTPRGPWSLHRDDKLSTLWVFQRNVGFAWGYQRSPYLLERVNMAVSKKKYLKINRLGIYTIDIVYISLSDIYGI